MRLIAGTFRYLIKNFLFIFVFAIIPSYFYAMSLEMNNIRALTQNLLSGEAPEFGQLFTFISFVYGRQWVFSLLCIALLIVCLPMLFGLIEKHMRIGIRSFRGIPGRFNTNVLPTIIVLFILLAIYELWALIASGLLYAETLLFGGVACTIVVVVTYLALLALMCYIASVLLLWLPCQLITGYSFMDALSYSNQLYVGQKGGLFLAVYLPCAAGAVLELLFIGVFGPSNVQIPVFFVMELLFIVLLLYYCILMFVAYFRLTGEERADLRKKY